MVCGMAMKVRTIKAVKAKITKRNLKLRRNLRGIFLFFTFNLKARNNYFKLKPEKDKSFFHKKRKKP